MPRVVVAGGGMAGALTAKLLENDADVTLVDCKEYFEIRWAILRAYVEPSFAEKIIIPHKEYLKKAAVVVGLISGVADNELRLEDGTTLPFDYLVITTGSMPEPSISAAAKIAQFAEEFKKLKAAGEILIVGGGPVGVEFAGEVLTDLKGKKVTIVHGGDRLMDFLKPKASTKALTVLKKMGAQVIFNDRVEGNLHEQAVDGVYTTKAGKRIHADYKFVATGSRPNAAWLRDGLPDAVNSEGRVKVDAYLNIPGKTHIFALGDITDIPEAKQGYFAMEHARRASFNIKQLIAKENGAPAKPLKPYKAGPEIGIVSLGRAHGVAQLPFGTITGWMPTNLKSKALFVPKVRAELGLSA
eukprot:TRINITY_DN26389_c0_g1_i1.p1 TRINITY_DN26389_c0_g1~~TRINITY_DN26389_c0_g1_i1.p1  ORF type:complete len:356 (-),score=69.74 TRINITY_DN26389_c0_g1_i1:745-1812(-)